MDKTLGTITRIDQARGLLRADSGLPEISRPSSPDEIAAAAGLVSERVLAQVQTQAEQLAEHLRSRQRELDRQEAQLNARCLELENEMRTFRLWASEREEALGERERLLQQQSAGLANRAAEAAAAEEAVVSQRQTTAELAAQRAAELAAQRAAELQTREFALAQNRQQLDEQTLALQNAEGQVDEQRQLTTARLLAERQRLAADRQSAADVFRRVHRRLQEQRTNLHTRAARQQQAERELQEAKLRLEQRNARLDERDAALQQLHRDIARRHGETLESRLLAEQLWAKLSRTVPSAELSESRHAVWQQLSDHYREVREANEQQAQQLRQLATKLEAQQFALLTQRRTLEDGLRRRQAELEQQGRHWTTRERAVDQQRWQSWELQQQWTKQRQEFLRQLRDALGPQPDDRSAA